MLTDYLKRAFYRPNWKLAIRESDDCRSLKEIIDDKKAYEAYITEKNFWCADPFIVREGSKTYIFCEYYDEKNKKGMIAAGEYRDGKLNEMKIVIEQDYHMSYPCIFKYYETFYMIPETAENKTIELYEAKEFPYVWELIETIAEDINCVDSTVFILEDELYLIGYLTGGSKNKVFISLLDIENGKLTFMDEFIDDNTGRPAGNIIFLDNRLFRPSQISKIKYGEAIAFEEILSIMKGKYNENVFMSLAKKDIHVENEKRIDRIHTFNKVENLEVIDYSHDTFELSKPVKIIASKINTYAMRRK
jgi:hypothetical protein